jgi:hypothetical protein
MGRKSKLVSLFDALATRGWNPGDVCGWIEPFIGAITLRPDVRREVDRLVAKDVYATADTCAIAYSRAKDVISRQCGSRRRQILTARS